jgi:PAS domain S-box-containing protein
MPTTLFPTAGPELRARLETIETVRLVNHFDWAATPLGPIPQWSQSLKGAVRVVVSADTPMVLMVGPEGYLIYNDAYAEFAGTRHPHIFAKPATEAWPEIADFNRRQIELAAAGESLTLRDHELILNRHGAMESVWLDLHYSPVLNDDGTTEAVLCVFNEITERKLAEQALARSEERLSLALSGSNMIGTWDWDVERNVVTADDRFARLHGVDSLRAGLGVPFRRYLETIHRDDLPAVLAAVRGTLSSGEPLSVEYRVVDEEGETRTIVSSGRARFNTDGKVIRFPGVAVDITEQKRVSEALAKSELEFRILADTMPQMVWATRPDGYHDYYNRRWYEFTGLPEGSTDGDGWNGVFHSEDQERAWGLWRRSLETGEPYQIEYRLRHHSGQYRWTLGRALPVRDTEGKVLRWIGTCTDIHDSKIAAEERELIAQELSHRIKNLFAVLTGLVSLSARNRPEVKDFADELRQRIYALGEAHDFVRPRSTDPAPVRASLQDLVTRLLTPYEGQDRLSFSGENTEIDEGAATPLALLIHELATNSAKYGALSRQEGRISLSGHAEGDDYVMTWRERGGPPVEAPPQTEGFGSRVVSLTIEGQLRGSFEREWSREGMELTVRVPLSALRRSAALGAIS